MAPPATALDGPGLKFAVQTILDQTLTQSIDDAMDGKLAELQDVFRKMIDKMAVDLAELRSVVEKRGRQLDATEKHAKVLVQTRS
jgi:translation initiation factor 2 gamma subunit (eIF-2gamma)